MHYKSTALLVLALLGGAVCSVVVKSMFFGSAPEVTSQVKGLQTQVLVANSDLVAGTELTPQNIRFDLYPEEKVPKDAIVRYAGIEQRRVLRAIAKNQPISLFDLEIREENKRDETTFVPPGYSIVPIRIEGVSHGGSYGDFSSILKMEELFAAGDKVNLSIVQEDQSPKEQEMSGHGNALKLVVKLLVENADVYKVTTETSPGTGDKLKKTSVVSLLLNRENAELVKDAARDGKLRLTLLEKKLQDKPITNINRDDNSKSQATFQLQNSFQPFKLKPMKPAESTEVAAQPEKKPSVTMVKKPVNEVNKELNTAKTVTQPAKSKPDSATAEKAPKKNDSLTEKAVLTVNSNTKPKVFVPTNDTRLNESTSVKTNSGNIKNKGTSFKVNPEGIAWSVNKGKQPEVQRLDIAPATEQPPVEETKNEVRFEKLPIPNPAGEFRTRPATQDEASMQYQPKLSPSLSLSAVYSK